MAEPPRLWGIDVIAAVYSLATLLMILLIGIGSDIGQAGRYLSGISQFLTKKANLHLRQVVEFESGGTLGETKDNYRVIDEYRDLLEDVLREVVE